MGCVFFKDQAPEVLERQTEEMKPGSLVEQRGVSTTVNIDRTPAPAYEEPTSSVQKMINSRSESSRDRRRNRSLLQNLVNEEFRRQITEVYNLDEGKLLGRGGFGTVSTVQHKQTGKMFALKAVELSRVKDEKSLDFFLKEVEIMRKLDHPNICRLQEVYTTPDFLFMVMDLYEGGDLLAKYRFKSEWESAAIVRKITNAVRYMHKNKIAHRDLKLDNILLESDAEGAEIKLVDFGLSAHFEDFKLEHDVVGTWVYMAPEVISGSHFPTACDMWSVGVIAYLLLCGYPPFVASSTAELKRQIQHGTYQFHSQQWSGISAKAKNFIKRLLVRNPQERMSATEAQRHPWLSEGSRPEGSEGVINEDAVNNLIQFKETTYLKKVALELVARSLDADQIRMLENEFTKYDLGGSGTINLEEFETVLSTQPGLSRAEIRAMFDSVDLDKDGEVHFNDFLAATLGRKELDERRMELAFDRLDFDHSGKISAMDLKLIVGSDLGAEGIKQVMAEWDLDGDGNIDFDEFKLAMKKADVPTRTLSRMLTREPQSKQDLTSGMEEQELAEVLKKGIQDISDLQSSGSSSQSLSSREVIQAVTLFHAAQITVEKQKRRATLASNEAKGLLAMVRAVEGFKKAGMVKSENLRRVSCFSEREPVSPKGGFGAHVMDEVWTPPRETVLPSPIPEVNGHIGDVEVTAKA